MANPAANETTRGYAALRETLWRALEVGDLKAGREPAERCTADGTDDPEVLAVASTMLLWCGLWDKAHKCLERAAKNAPENPFVLAAQCEFESFMGEKASAAAHANQAMESGCEHGYVLERLTSVLLMAGNAEAAVASARRWVETSPQSPAAHSCYIIMLNGSGNREGADAALEAAEELFPDSPLIMKHRARTYVTTQQVQKALALFEKAVEAMPGAPSLAAEYAVYLAHCSRYDEAERAAQRALSISTCVPQAYRAMRTVCLGRGQKKEAEEWGRKADTAIPGLWTVQVGQAVVSAIAEQNWTEVLRLCDRLHEAPMESTRVLAAHWQVRALLETNDTEHCQAALESIAQGRNIQCSYYEILGRLRLRRGDTEGAVDAFQQGLQRWPASGKLRGNLLRALHTLGRADEEKALADTTIGLTPESPAEIAELFVALNECGYNAEAKKLLTEGRRIHPHAEILKLAEAGMRIGRGDIDGADEIMQGVHGRFEDTARLVQKAARFSKFFRPLAQALKLRKKQENEGNGRPPIPS